MFVTRRYAVIVAIAACWLYSTSLLTAQVPETQKRYVRVGTLQSRFTAYGSERAWNDVYYEGLTWPSDYNYHDNSVIERTWIGCADFTDSKAQHWENYCVAFTQAFAGISVFPMVHKQTAKVDLPLVFVDGTDISAAYRGEIDELDVCNAVEPCAGVGKYCARGHDPHRLVAGDDTCHPLEDGWNHGEVAQPRGLAVGPGKPRGRVRLPLGRQAVVWRDRGHHAPPQRWSSPPYASIRRSRKNGHRVRDHSIRSRSHSTTIVSGASWLAFTSCWPLGA